MIRPVLDVEVIESPAAATVALHPVRSRLLAEFAHPSSAAALATRLDLPRQRVNDHLRALEVPGLVAQADTGKWGGLIERTLSDPDAAAEGGRRSRERVRERFHVQAQVGAFSAPYEELLRPHRARP